MKKTGNVFRKEENEVYDVPENVKTGALVASEAAYRSQWNASTDETSDAFWSRHARELVSWYSPFSEVQAGGFERGDIAWFLNGKLNVCYNCVDRWAAVKPDATAIIWEGDEPGDVRHISYKDLLMDVCRIANLLKRAGVRRGDPVCIYLPNCPEAAAAMLACARLGAVHSVVFAGFSAEALQARIQDGNSKVLFTADEFTRGGKHVKLKEMANEALENNACPTCTTVFVLKRTGAQVDMVEGRDVWLHDALETARPYCPCEVLDSEDPLFMLYTSGSTGKPKGLVHTLAGYLVFTALTHKTTFDYRDGDVYACVADLGWITGHSYILYGPLCNGATTFMFESTPLYPDAGRYWDMVERHGITQFYTAPTAIRAVQKFGDEFVTKYDRSTLRVLGTVGEPINPEAWRWYFEVVGEKRAAVVDTYWQTESGGHLLTPMPGATKTKPGSCSLPFFGIVPTIINPETGAPVEGNGVMGILAIAKPWPSIARTIHGNHKRYLSTYMSAYPGFYFTGDRATRDNDGYYWIGGRVDDVINVAGHRIGTAEVESAITTHEKVAECAVIAVQHEVKGQAIFAYVVVNKGVSHGPEMVKEIKEAVRHHIGHFAAPDQVAIVDNLPKTRSGKTLRRLLRKIAEGSKEDELGDISTIADHGVVPAIIAVVKALPGHH